MTQESRTALTATSNDTLEGRISNTDLVMTRADDRAAMTHFCFSATMVMVYLCWTDDVAKVSEVLLTIQESAKVGGALLFCFRAIIKARCIGMSLYKYLLLGPVVTGTS